jgi:hypothetical protein
VKALLLGDMCTSSKLAIVRISIKSFFCFTDRFSVFFFYITHFKIKAMMNLTSKFIFKQLDNVSNCLIEGMWWLYIFFFSCNPILFQICTSTFSKLCEQV